MKRLRWQIFIVILALVAIALLLLNQQGQPVLPGPGAPTPQPAQGGAYTEALIGKMVRLNPLLDDTNPADRDINSLLYSSLVKFNDRGVPEGDLAESWGISQDGTAYNFSLRQNVQWHDGQPLTANDIAFTINLMKNPAIPIPEDVRALWQEIEVTVLDEFLLQFRLPESYSPFLDHLAFGILPEHLLKDVTPESLVDAAFNLNPVGSGPYRFDAVQVNEQGGITGVTLVAFENYYGERAFIDQLEFIYFADAAAALQAYRDEVVMGISQVTPDILEEALAIPDLNLYTSRSPRMTLILFNLGNPEVPFFAEVNIRKAFLYALNRQRLINQVLSGQAILANGPIFPGTWAYYDGIEQYAYAPEQALVILREEGFEIPAEGGATRTREGIPLAFELLIPEGELYQQQAALVKENWEQVGAEVTVRAVPYDELVTEYLVGGRNYQAALVDINLSQSPDPDPYPFWHQAQITGGQNYSGWDDRTASEYLEQARVTLDMGERTRLYRNFQIRFTREMPALPLYYSVYSFGMSDEVQGVSIGPLFDSSDRLSNIEDWYLVSALAPTDN